AIAIGPEEAFIRHSPRARRPRLHGYSCRRLEPFENQAGFYPAFAAAGAQACVVPARRCMARSDIADHQDTRTAFAEAFGRDSELGGYCKIHKSFSWIASAGHDRSAGTDFAAQRPR